MFDLNGKNILITGGTGSFGKKCVEILLKEYKPKKIIIFSRDELKQHEMRTSPQFNSSIIRYFIGDVRDKERLYRAFREVDVVIHAAALKQVPACEYNPIEAVKTNIIGCVNVIDAAIDMKVSRVLALSTDKAAGPPNLYGATKLVAEKLFIQANHYTGDKGTPFACVRYGNVVGSRGSIVPLFKKQRSSGVITITDERMTRFWLSLNQGVHFVLSSIEKMVGGEVFIPKIPSMKIVDIAKLIGPECEQKIIGIRGGEKLHESMITEHESIHVRDMNDRYVILSDFIKNNPAYEKLPTLPSDFIYRSDLNEKWLTPDEMQALIDED
ncbi:MAG: UDP-N-acetylglucosamine 4,6-dehydratase (inverting) [Alphaproteobacteria bacterium ADurb.Bin438]|nr:MAG: UDP-N-acetylglucosamine 4,6-dehydratase (inverting) [Alphaproteobacteria bacterium ADurb.Bin438]